MWKHKLMIIVAIVVIISLGLVSAMPKGKSDSASGGEQAGTDDNFLHNAAYIKFEGIDGEAQDKDHKTWSDLMTFQHGISNEFKESRVQRRQVDPEINEILVTKELDKATPKLAESCVEGKVIPKVEIHLTERYTDAGRQTYYACELKNVIITSYVVSGGSSGEDVPTEELSLNFEEIKVTYTEYDREGKSKGNVETEFKVEKGE